MKTKEFIMLNTTTAAGCDIIYKGVFFYAHTRKSGLENVPFVQTCHKSKTAELSAGTKNGPPFHPIRIEDKYDGE